MVLAWLFGRLVDKSQSETGLEYTARRGQTRTLGVGPSLGNLNDFSVPRRRCSTPRVRQLQPPASALLNELPVEGRGFLPSTQVCEQSSARLTIANTRVTAQNGQRLRGYATTTRMRGLSCGQLPQTKAQDFAWTEVASARKGAGSREFHSW